MNMLNNKFAVKEESMVIVPKGIDKKSIKRKEMKPEEIKDEAIFYREATNILDKNRRSGELFPPILMNAAFACELFSKYILYVSGGDNRKKVYKEKGEKSIIFKKHSLWELYHNFEKEDKDCLCKYSNKSKERFERFVQEITDMFEIWRYRYEYEINSSHYSFVLEYMELLKMVAETK